VRIRYEAVYSRRFREAFSYELDEEGRKRVDDWIWRLRTAEIEGMSNGLTLEVETEAGEIIRYDRKGRILAFLDLRVHP